MSTSVYRYDIRGVSSDDARLIAAAPELLVSLKALTDAAQSNMVGGNGHLIDDARAAIAKAEGTSPHFRFARAKVSA